jgi:hypothetical protein
MILFSNWLAEAGTLLLIYRRFYAISYAAKRFLKEKHGFIQFSGRNVAYRDAVFQAL